MSASLIDRSQGILTSVAVKAPCRVAATSAVALTGLYTIGSVTLAAGDRVLVTAQASSVDNGIWIAGTGAWTRATDFNGARDAVSGTLVPVNVGPTFYRLTTADPVSIGSSALTFSALDVSTAGSDLVTATGASTPRSLADHLGDFLTSDDEPVATLAVVGYANRALIKVAAGETVKLPCDPTTDDFGDMCAWAQAGHIREGGGEGPIIVIEDGLHEVSDHIPVKMNELYIRGSATPTEIEVTAVAYTSLGSDLYRATVTVDEALPARVVVGWCIFIGPVVADGITHPCSGAHEVLTIAGDRLSFTYNFRSHGRVAADATNTTSMTAGTSFGMTNNVCYVPFFTIHITGGWTGSSQEGFFRVEKDGRLTTEFCAFVYKGTGDANRSLVFMVDGATWNNQDYSGFVGGPNFTIRGGQGGKGWINRLFVSNPDGTECAQILSAGITFVRAILNGGTTACLTFGAASSEQSTSCMAMGSPIGLRSTGEGAVLRWDSSYAGWCDTGVRATAGRVSFNSSACVIERCTDPMGFGSSASDKYITGSPTIQNNTNAAIQRGVLINGGRWIDSSDAWTPSIVSAAVSESVDFGALGTDRAWVAAPSTITVTGAVTTDTVLVHRVGSAFPEGIMIIGVVTSTDTVTLYACDMKAANQNPSGITLRVAVLRCA